MSTLVTILLEHAGEGEIPKEMDDGNSEYGAGAGNAWEELNQIADELGVSPLNSFIFDEDDYQEKYRDYDSDEDVEEEEEDVDEDYEEHEEWYEPGPALATVIEVSQYLQETDPGILKRKFHNVFIGEKLKEVLRDLKVYEHILEQAERDKDRFRFELG